MGKNFEPGMHVNRKTPISCWQITNLLATIIDSYCCFFFWILRFTD